MSIAQRVFLHPPAWSTELIGRYVSQHITENEHLDLKSPPGWNDGIDAAKDVAAFANHLGGDIIIGIDEDGNDRAKDWNPIPNSEIAELEEKASNWLKAHLYPREFVQTVRMERVPANIANHSVLVISIPPYPDLVGIEKTGNRKGEIDFRFPIRVGNSTRWLIFEEIMKRFANSTRGTFIKLKGLVDAFGTGAVPLIGFISPVLVVAGKKLMPLPVEGGIHCSFADLTPDVLSVRMRGSTGFVTGTVSLSVPSDYKLTIPLEFIRAVWKDKKLLSQPEHISIALDVTPIWRGLFWELTTGSFI